MKKFVLLGVCLVFFCIYVLNDLELIKKVRES